MTTEPTTLDDRIIDLIATLQEQRIKMGDGIVKLSLKMALSLSRMKAKDKEEHDKAVKENKLLQEFCKDIGYKL